MGESLAAKTSRLITYCHRLKRPKRGTNRTGKRIGASCQPSPAGSLHQGAFPEPGDNVSLELGTRREEIRASTPKGEIAEKGGLFQVLEEKAYRGCVGLVPSP